MLDAADIPHEGSAVMAESAWLAAAKSMLQKLMFKDLSFRHRHKHLQIVRGNITQSTCCREEHAAEADVRGTYTPRAATSSATATWSLGATTSTLWTSWMTRWR